MQFVLQVAVAMAVLAVMSVVIWWMSQRKTKFKIEPYVSGDGIASKPALVLFYADWCGHCKNFEDSWTDIRAKLRDSVEVTQVEQSKEPALFKTYGISGFPTIMFLPRGGNTAPSDAVTFRGERGVKDVVDFANAQLARV